MWKGEQKMEDVSILKEINKDSKMGMDSLSIILKKVEDEDFKKVLNNQHDEYQNIFDRTQELLVQEKEDIKDTSPMIKTMSWMGIQLNTINDNSNSKLSEILIQGNNMGIIKGTKLLNDGTYKEKQVKNILNDFVRLQEKNIDDLKKYL